MEINEDGAFAAGTTERYTVNEQLIVCPTCGADKGLVFTAFAIDKTSLGSCPNRHTWDEPRVNGEVVRDLYLALVGQPTRCSTVVQDPPNVV